MNHPTIDEQDILAHEFQSHRIQLSTDILFSAPGFVRISFTRSFVGCPPHFLPRHDKCPTNIAVLHKAFSIRQL
jgi:hypothetical protein